MDLVEIRKLISQGLSAQEQNNNAAARRLYDDALARLKRIKPCEESHKLLALTTSALDTLNKSVAPGISPTSLLFSGRREGDQLLNAEQARAEREQYMRQQQQYRQQRSPQTLTPQQQQQRLSEEQQRLQRWQWEEYQRAQYEQQQRLQQQYMEQQMLAKQQEEQRLRQMELAEEQRRQEQLRMEDEARKRREFEEMERKRKEEAAIEAERKRREFEEQQIRLKELERKRKEEEAIEAERKRREFEEQQKRLKELEIEQMIQRKKQEEMRLEQQRELERQKRLFMEQEARKLEEARRYQEEQKRLKEREMMLDISSINNKDEANNNLANAFGANAIGSSNDEEDMVGWMTYIRSTTPKSKSVYSSIQGMLGSEYRHQWTKNLLSTDGLSSQSSSVNTSALSASEVSNPSELVSKIAVAKPQPKSPTNNNNNNNKMLPPQTPPKQDQSDTSIVLVSPDVDHPPTTPSPLLPLHQTILPPPAAAAISSSSDHVLPSPMFSVDGDYEVVDAFPPKFGQIMNSTQPELMKLSSFSAYSTAASTNNESACGCSRFEWLDNVVRYGTNCSHLTSISQQYQSQHPPLPPIAQPSTTTTTSSSSAQESILMSIRKMKHQRPKDISTALSVIHSHDPSTAAKLLQQQAKLKPTFDPFNAADLSFLSKASVVDKPARKQLASLAYRIAWHCSIVPLHVATNIDEPPPPDSADLSVLLCKSFGFTAEQHDQLIHNEMNSILSSPQLSKAIFEERSQIMQNTSDNGPFARSSAFSNPRAWESWRTQEYANLTAMKKRFDNCIAIAAWAFVKRPLSTSAQPGMMRRASDVMLAGIRGNSKWKERKITMKLNGEITLHKCSSGMAAIKNGMRSPASRLVGTWLLESVWWSGANPDGNINLNNNNGSGGGNIITSNNNNNRASDDCYERILHLSVDGGNGVMNIKVQTFPEVAAWNAAVLDITGMNIPFCPDGSLSPPPAKNPKFAIPPEASSLASELMSSDVTQILMVLCHAVMKAWVGDKNALFKDSRLIDWLIHEVSSRLGTGREWEVLSKWSVSCLLFQAEDRLMRVIQNNTGNIIDVLQRRPVCEWRIAEQKLFEKSKTHFYEQLQNHVLHYKFWVETKNEVEMLSKMCDLVDLFDLVSPASPASALSSSTYLEDKNKVFSWLSTCAMEHVKRVWEEHEGNDAVGGVVLQQVVEALNMELRFNEQIFEGSSLEHSLDWERRGYIAGLVECVKIIKQRFGLRGDSGGQQMLAAFMVLRTVTSLWAENHYPQKKNNNNNNNNNAASRMIVAAMETEVVRLLKSFNWCVGPWVEEASRNLVIWCERACHMDTLEVEKDQQNSTSVVDVAFACRDTVTFFFEHLEGIGWDPVECSPEFKVCASLREGAAVVCSRACQSYVAEMAGRIPGLLTAAEEPLVGKCCVAIRCMYEIQAFQNSMSVDIITNVANRFGKIDNRYGDNSSDDDINNRLVYQSNASSVQLSSGNFLPPICDNAISTMRRFLLESVSFVSQTLSAIVVQRCIQPSGNNGGAVGARGKIKALAKDVKQEAIKAKNKIANALKEHGKGGMDIEEEFEVKVSAAVMQMNDYLEILSEGLPTPLFSNLLKKIWKDLTSDCLEVLLSEAKSQSSAKLARKVERLHHALEDLLRADGDGLPEEDLLPERQRLDNAVMLQRK